ncbi:aspartic peptidase domain-containing protein [Suillus spraguei]|nr:aspartic peptidase domain-containing protein [Suillus spraguei]
MPMNRLRKMVLSRSLSYLLALPGLAFISLSASALPHPRAASSTAALKLAVRINTYGIKNIVDADRARIQALRAGGSSSVNATNVGMLYIADIGVGSPATYHTLLLDTGSSNTWIGGTKSYEQTITSHDTGNQFYAAYGGHSYVSGKEYTDTVTLNSALVIHNQSIGVVSETSGISGLDGILGLGPVDLTQGTVNNTYEVATVIDNLYTQKTIRSEVFGMLFAPTSSDDSGGELTFGSYDPSKITGHISYVSITSTPPANRYWGIDQSITYGDTEILSGTAGIVDSGTTFILIATDAFDKYRSATGATIDENTGLLKISSDQYNQLSSLYFTIGEVTYELTSNGQIWPRSLNSVINGTTDGIYLVISDSGTHSGSGLDFTNGYCFLERFYSVYDTTYSRVGFATTEYTYATTN